MGNYYSPNGNFEVWDEKPEGYYTEKEWAVLHPTPVPTLEEVKKDKLTELNTQFDNARKTAWIISSIGFKSDANDIANMNIDGLIKTTKATGKEPVYFCDRNNQYHALGLAELETLQLEVIQNGQNLYAQKWTYRDAINAATTVEEIQAVDIQLTMMDFTA